MMEEGMTEKQLVAALIEEYANLQRIKMAPNRDEEINYQIGVAKAKLKLFGIAAEKLDLDK